MLLEALASECLFSLLTGISVDPQGTVQENTNELTKNAYAPLIADMFSVSTKLMDFFLLYNQKTGYFLF